MSPIGHQSQPLNAAAAMLPLALTAEQVASLLGISRATVFRLKDSGKLPRPVRFGRALRWDRSTLEAWMAAGAPPRERWEAMNNHSSNTRRRNSSS